MMAEAGIVKEKTQEASPVVAAVCRCLRVPLVCRSRAFSGGAAPVDALSPCPPARSEAHAMQLALSWTFN